MVKDILDNIKAAEEKAAQIEKDGMLRAREIHVEAQNKADELREANEKSLKEAVKKIMADAAAEGEKRAEAKVRAGHDAAKAAAGTKNMEKAVQYIQKGFTARL